MREWINRLVDVLRRGRLDRELAEELRKHVAAHLSPIAKPDSIDFPDKLPKTRSGKIMRRVLKARALGQDEGDLTTLEE